jgi:glutaredoxin-related protein
MSVPEVRVSLGLDEFVDLFVNKMKGDFGIGDNGVSVEKSDDGSYRLEFKNPVVTTDRGFKELERSLLYWGFFPIDEKVNEYVEVDGHRFLPVTTEFMNNDGVRVTLVYRNEHLPTETETYIDKVIIGTSDIIKNRLSEKAEEIINVLEEFEVDYHHRVGYWSRTIEIPGDLIGIRVGYGFLVKYNHCKTVGIREKTETKPAQLVVADSCEDEVKEKAVDLSDDLEIEYSGRTLYLKFRYRY